MLTRFAYLIIVVVVGVGTIVLCRLFQEPFVEQGSAWVAGPIQGAVRYPIQAAGEFLQNVQGIGNLRQENTELRAEVERLQQESAGVAELRQENQLLREQLGFRQTQPGLRPVPARIIGYDANPLVSAAIVNIGTRDGIADGMTVITAQGLVGRVLRAGPSTSKVLLVTDFSSSVNALLQGSRSRGVVNGSPAGYLTMRYIGQGEVVHTGDRVVTSGLGGSFPSGILVGSVADVRQKDVDMFQEARLEPAVDFDRLEQVMVIISFLPTKLE